MSESADELFVELSKKIAEYIVMLKINGQQTNAKEFAYDGCHKIYILESKQDRAEAEDAEYDILPIENLKKVFNESCGLQFISNWNLSKRFVNQFQEACFEA